MTVQMAGIKAVYYRMCDDTAYTGLFKLIPLEKFNKHYQNAVVGLESVSFTMEEGKLQMMPMGMYTGRVVCHRLWMAPFEMIIQQGVGCGCKNPPTIPEMAVAKALTKQQWSDEVDKELEPLLPRATCFNAKK